MLQFKIRALLIATFLVAGLAGCSRAAGVQILVCGIVAALIGLVSGALISQSRKHRGAIALFAALTALATFTAVVAFVLLAKQFPSVPFGSYVRGLNEWGLPFFAFIASLMMTVPAASIRSDAEEPLVSILDRTARRSAIAATMGFGVYVMTIVIMHRWRLPSELGVVGFYTLFFAMVGGIWGLFAVLGCWCVTSAAGRISRVVELRSRRKRRRQVTLIRSRDR